MCLYFLCFIDSPRLRWFIHIRTTNSGTCSCSALMLSEVHSGETFNVPACFRFSCVSSCNLSDVSFHFTGACACIQNGSTSTWRIIFVLMLHWSQWSCATRELHAPETHNPLLLCCSLHYKNLINARLSLRVTLNNNIQLTSWQTHWVSSLNIYLMTGSRSKWFMCVYMSFFSHTGKSDDNYRPNTKWKGNRGLVPRMCFINVTEALNS